MRQSRCSLRGGGVNLFHLLCLLLAVTNTTYSNSKSNTHTHTSGMFFAEAKENKNPRPSPPAQAPGIAPVPVPVPVPAPVPSVPSSPNANPGISGPNGPSEEEAGVTPSPSPGPTISNTKGTSSTVNRKFSFYLQFQSATEKDMNINFKNLESTSEDYFDNYMDDVNIPMGQYFRSVTMSADVASFDARRNIRGRNLQAGADADADADADTSSNLTIVKVVATAVFQRDTNTPGRFDVIGQAEQAFEPDPNSAYMLKLKDEDANVYDTNSDISVSLTFDKPTNPNKETANNNNESENENGDVVVGNPISNGNVELDSDKPGFEIGSIVGIIVGLAAVGAAGFAFVNYKKRKASESENDDMIDKGTGHGNRNGKRIRGMGLSSLRKGRNVTRSNSITSASPEQPEMAVAMATLHVGDGGGDGGDDAEAGFELMSPSMMTTHTNTTTYSIQDTTMHMPRTTSKRSVGASTVGMGNFDMDEYSLGGESTLFGKTPNQGDKMLGQVLAMGEYTPVDGNIDTSYNSNDLLYSDSSKPAMIRVISELSAAHPSPDDTSDHKGDQDGDASVFTHSKHAYGFTRTTSYGHDSVGGNSMMSETYSTYGQNIIMGKNSNNMNANAIGNRGRTVTQDSAISTGLNSLAENDVTMDQEEGQDMDLNGIVSPLVDEEKLLKLKQIISPLSEAGTSPATSPTVTRQKLNFSIAADDQEYEIEDEQEAEHKRDIEKEKVNPTMIKISNIIETEKVTETIVSPSRLIPIPFGRKKTMTAREGPLERTYSEFHNICDGGKEGRMRNLISVTSSDAPRTTTKFESIPIQSARPLSSFRVVEASPEGGDNYYDPYANEASNSSDSSDRDEYKPEPAPLSALSGIAKRARSRPFRSKSRKAASKKVALKAASASPSASLQTERTLFPLQHRSSDNTHSHSSVPAVSPTHLQQTALNPHRHPAHHQPSQQQKSISSANYAALARRNRLNRLANTRNSQDDGTIVRDTRATKESLSNQVAGLRRARLQQRRG